MQLARQDVAASAAKGLPRTNSALTPEWISCMSLHCSCGSLSCFALPLKKEWKAASPAEKRSDETPQGVSPRRLSASHAESVRLERFLKINTIFYNVFGKSSFHKFLWRDAFHADHRVDGMDVFIGQADGSALFSFSFLLCLLLCFRFFGCDRKTIP